MYKYYLLIFSLQIISVDLTNEISSTFIGYLLFYDFFFACFIIDLMKMY